MTLQLPSDLIRELMRLERERREILSLSESWGVEPTQEQVRVSRENIKESIKKASGL